eukprot:335605_1
MAINCILFTLVLFVCHIIESQRINKPINGTGPIDISFGDVFYHNKDRILFVFNRTCVNQTKTQNRNRNTNNQFNDSNINESVEYIRNRYRMCLEITNNSHNVTHYATENYAYAFYDLSCSIASLSTGNYSNITINYNDLCIVYIMYEPLYDIGNINSSIIETVPSYTPSFTCMRLNTAYYKSYGMDLLDSNDMDYKYSYPQFDNITIANNHKIDLHILDSGIQSNHVEFYSYQIIHKMGDGPAIFDNNYGDHGTHVAGIIGGKNYGSSRNFTIYDYRVCEFTSDGKEMPCYGSLIFEALLMIYNHLKDTGKPSVINLSLGGLKVTPDEDAYHFYFQEIIKVGGIPVVAAGNENVDACTTSPAYTNNAITVGSYDRFKKKSGFSNWGNCVDIWAPGTSIYSSIASNKNDKYEYKQGTSMASPYIAGMIANILYINPQLTFNDIKTILLNTNINNYYVGGGVCDNEYKCKRAQYICESATIYDLPHVLTTLEIVLITLGCIVGVCIIILIIMWIVKKKKQKDDDKYKDNNWQYNQQKYDTRINMNTDNDVETQHINPSNQEGNVINVNQKNIVTQ